MTDQHELIDALDETARRRDERRAFFRTFGAAAAITGGAVMAGLASPAQAQAALTDTDVLNFALNVEYLEGNFYSYVLTGQPLPGSDAVGTGTQGAAVGGRQVTFTDPAVAALAREIGGNERSHAEFLRSQLGSAAIAQPQIDLSVSPTSAFSMVARAAGLIGPGESFDPYASDENFLLTSFLFEETGVTAFKGSATLLSNKTYVEAAAGILAVEAYQASALRTMLYRKGMQTPSLIDATVKISDAKDALDGPSDDDQGLIYNGQPNFVPTDSNSIAFGRTPGQVLNLVYLTSAAASKGGFFPNGVNGTVTMSTAEPAA